MALPPLAPLTQSGSTGPYIPTGYENTSADIQNKRAMAQHLIELGLAGPGAGARSWAQVLGSIAQAWAGKSIQGDALKEEAKMNSQIGQTVQGVNSEMAGDIHNKMNPTDFLTKWSSDPRARYAQENPQFKTMQSIAEQLGKSGVEMAGTGIESRNGPNGPVSGITTKDGVFHPSTDGTSAPREMKVENGIWVDPRNAVAGTVAPQSATAHVVRALDGTPQINTPAVQAARISQGIPTPTDGTPWGPAGMPTAAGVGAGPGQGLPTGGLPPQPNPALPPPAPTAATAMGAPGQPTSLSPDLPPIPPSPGHPNLPPPAPTAGPGLPTPIGPNGVDPLAPLPPGQGTAPPGLGTNPSIQPKAAEMASTLLNGGVPAPVVAGFMGNFHVEGGYNGANGDGGSSFGIAQWHGPRAINFQNVMGVSPQNATPEQQAQFVLHELKNPQEAGMSTAQRDAILQAQTPQQAAALIDQFYERSSGAARGDRIAAAGAFSGDTQGGGLPPAAPTTTGSNGAPSWASNAPPVRTMSPDQVKAAGLDPDYIYSQDRFGNPKQVGKSAIMATNTVPGDQTKTGAAYAATIPTGDRLIAQGIADGKIPFSTRMTSPSFIKYFKEASLIAGQPIDATTYARRNATATSFAAGKVNGMAMAQFRTVINHGIELADAIKGLGGSDGTGSGITNWIGNTVKGINNDQGLKKYQDIVNVYAPEKAKLLSGKAATDTATKEAAGNYNPNNGPAVLRTNLGEDLKLFTGRIQPLVDSYNEGMGTKYNITGFLSNVLKQPQDAQKWQKLQDFTSGKTSSPTGTPTPTFKSQGSQQLWNMLHPGGQ